jgi:galactokinase
MAKQTSIHRHFIDYFHKEPFVFSAPGRINLIGEHIDYNGGMVMPAAVNRSFTFAITPGQSDKCNIFADDLEEGLSFSIHDLNAGDTWVNYLMGVIDAFARRGKVIRGFDLVFGGDIPSGTGMSSSAALSCGFAFALNTIFESGLSRLELAKIAQYAEHEFAGVNCGMMDQYACLFGEPDSLLMLDCRSLTHQTLAFPLKEYSLMLVDTKVKHTLGSSAYNERRASCEEGLLGVQKMNPLVKSFRDITSAMLAQAKDQLSDETYKRCAYVIQEMERVQKTSQAIASGNLTEVGRLLYESHAGLSKQYEVSCAEADFLVSLAEEDKKAVLGARMMGGGFGGCTINLIDQGKESAFKEKVRSKYFAQFKKEPDFYSVKLSAGVRQINPGTQS